MGWARERLLCLLPHPTCPLRSTQDHFGALHTWGDKPLSSQCPAPGLPRHLPPPEKLPLLARASCSEGSFLPLPTPPTHTQAVPAGPGARPWDGACESHV